jgi:hypothetical protein
VAVWLAFVQPVRKQAERQQHLAVADDFDLLMDDDPPLLAP